MTHTPTALQQRANKRSFKKHRWRVQPNIFNMRDIAQGAALVLFGLLLGPPAADVQAL